MNSLLKLEMAIRSNIFVLVISFKKFFPLKNSKLYKRNCFIDTMKHYISLYKELWP